MTEDLRNWIVPLTVSEAPRWVLSGKDLGLLTRIHAEAWLWLGDLENGNAVIAAGRVIDALEALLEGRTIQVAAEFSTGRRVERQDGLGVGIRVAPEQIHLEAWEYVWNVSESHDRGTILIGGEATHVELTPQGSFDGDLVEAWLALAENATDHHHGESVCTAFAECHAVGGED